MHITARQEQFSRAYVRAIAAVAGFNICTYDVDNDSVDLGLAGKRREGADIRSPKLDVQLKSTTGDAGEGTELPLDLSLKNYDDLRDPNVHTPRILVVVCTPKEIGDWLDEQPEVTAMRRCAYWSSLRGLEPSKNDTKERVYLPRTQRFTVTALTEIMDLIGRGDRP